MTVGHILKEMSLLGVHRRSPTVETESWVSLPRLEDNTVGV